VDGLLSGDYGRIAESKLRILCEELNETVRIARIDNREHPLPPRPVGLPDTLWCDHGLIHSFSIRHAVAMH